MTSKTLEQKKADILAKAEKEMREAELSQKILDAWPLDDVTPSRVHVYGLYGTVASIAIGDSSRVKPDAVTVNEAIQIAERLNPEAALLVRDGHASFRPADSVPEDFDDRKLTAVAPYWLKLDWFGDKLSCFADIGGHKARVDIAVRDPEYRVSARRVEYKGGVRYEDSRPVYPRDHFTHSIIWGRGSEDYPNSITLYTY